MSRSTISDAALADDNLLRIHEWAEAWGAWLQIAHNLGKGVKADRVCVVSVMRGIGGPALPMPPEHDVIGHGATPSEAYGRAWDWLAKQPTRPTPDSARSVPAEATASPALTPSNPNLKATPHA